MALISHSKSKQQIIGIFKCKFFMTLQGQAFFTEYEGKIELPFGGLKMKTILKQLQKLCSAY